VISSRKLILAILMVATVVTSTHLSALTARATHVNASVTSPLDSSYETATCHGLPFYFKTIYGWARSCSGGHDIGNGGSSANVYLRGYNWANGRIVNALYDDLYTDGTCPPNQQPIGRQWNNAWQITLLTGTAGAAYHHMSSYYYGIGSVVSNGTLIGQQANWGVPVYYCPSKQLASDGPHIHMEAATDGTPDDTYLVDTWGLDNGVPYVNYRHP
jgi:hypothetical protein